MPAGAIRLERYVLIEPHAWAEIILLPKEKTMMYYLHEPDLPPHLKRALDDVSEIIETEINPRELEAVSGKPVDVIAKFFDRSIRRYKGIVKGLTAAEIDVLRYYVIRNFAGMGILEALLRDPYIEDISCNGVGVPIYVWHKRYESLPTNLEFVNRSSLNDYIVLLAHRSGKHVSVAFPILDAILPGMHRVAATYGTEVTPSGGSFTIRKFRAEPFSIAEQVLYGTLSPELVAYMWLLFENKMNALVIGATGAGKTSLLNSFCSLYKQNYKVVTVEETPEIHLSLPNWVRLVVREVYGVTGQVGTNITLFDLVRTSLRYRPDYIIVGEVRGEEAYVLFQAMATGHGGLTTMHAESIQTVVSRLTSPPMNISPAYIPLVNVVVHIERVMLRAGEGLVIPARRVRSLWEIGEYDKYLQLARWDPINDQFVHDFRESVMLERIAERTGSPKDEIIAELKRRALYVRWMAAKGVKKFDEVASLITQYYLDPEQSYMSAIVELEKLEKERLERLEMVLGGVSALYSTLDRFGAMDLVSLLRMSRMSEAVFWQSFNKLLKEGAIAIDENGLVSIRRRV
jgi:flagellar protein FlaI